ncbi:unnamed protein product [Heterobilharzia americana]|nr:unnamed protein product [Heterobilharzia americana]
MDISAPNENDNNPLINKIQSNWWCPLTDNFDHYPDWRSCPETASTYAGNEPGKQCHFPFLYRKRLYSTCIRTGESLYYANPGDSMPTDNGKSGYWWCSTTPDFDFDGKWTKCRPQLAYQLPCHFSRSLDTIGGFVQNSQHECQPFAGHWICHTELNQLRECPIVVQSLNNIRTEGGNDPGFPCHFPFQATIMLNKDESQSGNIARKQNFTRCLPGIGEPIHSQQLSIYPTWIGYWCATTENFDRDKLWTRCQLNYLPLSSSRYVHKFTLSEIWSKLYWLTMLTDRERNKLRLPNRLTENDFSQSLNHLEYLRASWEIFENHNLKITQETPKYSDDNNELTWWIWLAPFWWINYKLNHSYSSDLLFQETGENRLININNNNDNNNKEYENPLIQSFNFPLWLDDWSESAWNNYAIHMKNRWNHLITYLHNKWLQSWLIAFSIGFLSAIGIIIISLLIIFLWLKKSIRLQIINNLIHSKYQTHDKSVFDRKYEVKHKNSHDNNVDNETVHSDHIYPAHMRNIEQLQDKLYSNLHCRTSVLDYNNMHKIPCSIRRLQMFNRNVNLFQSMNSTNHVHSMFNSGNFESEKYSSVSKPMKNALQSCCYSDTWNLPIYESNTLNNNTDNYCMDCISSNDSVSSNNIKEYIKYFLAELIRQSFTNENKLSEHEFSRCLNYFSRIIDFSLTQHDTYYHDEKEFTTDNHNYLMDIQNGSLKCCLQHKIDSTDHKYTYCQRVIGSVVVISINIMIVVIVFSAVTTFHQLIPLEMMTVR